MSVKAAQYPASVWNGLGVRASRNDDIDPNYQDWDKIAAEVLAMETYNDPDVITVVNNTGGASVIGTPVYLDSNGKAVKADANGSGTRHVMGLIYDDGVANAGNIKVKWKGIMTLTTDQWDTICGTTGGLTPGAPYYLSVTVGTLTGTAPNTTGDTVNRVILALSSTQALVLCRFEKTV